jgi:hypothetical protein
VGALTEGQDRHLSTLDICGNIEIEKRKEYPKHECRTLKMEEIEHSLWPHIFQYREPKL